LKQIGVNNSQLSIFQELADCMTLLSTISLSLSLSLSLFFFFFFFFFFFYLLPGTLGDILHRKTHDSSFLTSELKREFAQHIAAGLNFMHSQNPPICHRDIRSFNIFVCRSFSCFVCYDILTS
jgi:serine/threonine protein kinase